MRINLPYQVRAVLYVLTAVGSPVIAYLLARGTIGEMEVALWSAEVTVINIMAALNVTNPEGEQ